MSRSRASEPSRLSPPGHAWPRPPPPWNEPSDVAVSAAVVFVIAFTLRLAGAAADAALAPGSLLLLGLACLALHQAGAGLSWSWPARRHHR
jgi:hypothetical protein